MGFGCTAGNDSLLRKWSTIRPIVADTIEAWQPAMGSIAGMMDTTRWRAALPCRKTVVVDRGALEPASKVCKPLLWAVHYNAVFNRAVMKNPAIAEGGAVVLLSYGTQSEAYVCNHKYRYTYQLCKVTIKAID